ncbi:hypothetical protein G6011_08526 [Alternaria panax]|uniref:Uncharacterized protein n=1 Tax=Alternaria panax TaxID=48097 RepID=A0AAD4I8P6_9PLEO|nr:hypothetical protein G6011_08526 [Alternaria panax]
MTGLWRYGGFVLEAVADWPQSSQTRQCGIEYGPNAKQISAGAKVFLVSRKRPSTPCDMSRYVVRDFQASSSVFRAMFPYHQAFAVPELGFHAASNMSPDLGLSIERRRGSLLPSCATHLSLFVELYAATHDVSPAPVLNALASRLRGLSTTNLSIHLRPSPASIWAYELLAFRRSARGITL